MFLSKEEKQKIKKQREDEAKEIEAKKTAERLLGVFELVAKEKIEDEELLSLYRIPFFYGDRVKNNPRDLRKILRKIIRDEIQAMAKR